MAYGTTMVDGEQTADVASNAAAAGGGIGGGMAALSLIGTLFGAWGQHETGQANKRLAEYNANVAEYQADDAIKRGEVAAGRRRLQTKQVIGDQRVSLASQGVEINEGSAVDVQANAAYLGELDAVTIKNNAAREAWGYKVQAKDLTARGNIAAMTADSMAANTLLTGSSNLMLARYGFGRSVTATDPLLWSK